MNVEHLTMAEAQIAAMAVRTQQDGFLRDLVQLADHGVETPIVLLTNGMVIVGNLASPEVIAEHLDQSRRRAIQDVEKPDELSDKDWEEATERFVNDPTSAVELTKEREEKLVKEIKAFESESEDGDQMPRDLELGLIERENRPHLTLKNVQIVAPGQTGRTHAPLLRVNVSMINAWWTPETDDSGTARFVLFETDTPDA